MSNLKLYCQSCGQVHAYTLQKPNFCQSCGTSLGSTSSPSPDIKQQGILEVEESFENNLTALECDFLDYTPTTQTLGSIMDQNQAASNPIKKSTNVEPRNTLSPEETLKQLKQESSAIRPKSSN